MRDAVDERLGDLHDVHREAVEVAERRVARAEVVDRELHAQLLEVGQGRRGGFGVLEQDGLRDFEDQAAGRQARCLERRAHLLDHARVLELAPAQVHAHRQRRLDGVRELPLARLPAGLTQHPAADRDDEAGLLRERDEVERRHEAALGVVPAHERLDRRDPAAGQVDGRLVVDHELVALERLLELGLQLEALERGEVHVRLEELVAALAAALGDVHGHVRVAQQLLGSLAGSAGARGDADARVHEGALPVDLERRAQRLDHAVGHAGRLGGVGHVLEQDRELVAAESRGGVAAAQAVVDALGDRHEQVIAGGVAEAVVDRLEVVHVEEEHGDPARLAHPAGKRVLDAIREQRTVGKARERVVEGAVGELILELLAVAHVAGGEEHAAHVRVVREVLANRLDVAPRAVGMAHPPADGRGHVTGLERLEEEGDRGLDVVRMHDVEDRLALEPGRVVAEDSLHRRALVHDPPLDVDDGDDVGGVLHERPEALLAAAEVGGELGALERERHVARERAEAVLEGVRQAAVGGDHERAAKLAVDEQRDAEQIAELGRVWAGRTLVRGHMARVDRLAREQALAHVLLKRHLVPEHVVGVIAGGGNERHRLVIAPEECRAHPAGGGQHRHHGVHRSALNLLDGSGRGEASARPHQHELAPAPGTPRRASGCPGTNHAQNATLWRAHRRLVGRLWVVLER